jgi:hypothetical protein
MAVNAISPKYFPLVMSASTWFLPTGSRTSGQERGSLRFHAFLEEKQRRVWRVGSTSACFGLCDLNFILLNCDARSAHVQEVQRCANRSFLDDGCTFCKWLHLKLLQCQIPLHQNAIRQDTRMQVAYHHKTDALLHDLIIKATEERKLIPTSLHKLKLSLFLCGRLYQSVHSLVLFTSFLHRP